MKTSVFTSFSLLMLSSLLFSSMGFADTLFHSDYIPYNDPAISGSGSTHIHCVEALFIKEMKRKGVQGRITARLRSYNESRLERSFWGNPVAVSLFLPITQQKAEEFNRQDLATGQNFQLKIIVSNPNQSPVIYDANAIVNYSKAEDLSTSQSKCFWSSMKVVNRATQVPLIDVNNN